MIPTPPWTRTLVTVYSANYINQDNATYMITQLYDNAYVFISIYMNVDY